MKLRSDRTIDGGHEVRLVGTLPSGHETDEWNASVVRCFELYESYAFAGGLGDGDAQGWQPGELRWHNSSFSYVWPAYVLGAPALAVLVRILSRLRMKDGSTIDSIALLGSPVKPDQGLVIIGVEAEMNGLPRRVSALPFEVEICPYGSWLNIQCDLLEGFPPDVPAELDRDIRVWGKVADAGGFRIGEHDETPFGVGISGPTVAADFVEWHCLMTGVPPESINGLLNVISFFSKRTFPVRSVYIG